MTDEDVQILQVIECSSMVSSWKEYLCIEIRDGRAALSHRRYDVLGEISDFAVETDDGDEEYRIPDVIDGKRVVGTEDEFVVGGELTADPSDPEPEIEFTGADPDKVRAWLEERGFDPKAVLDEARDGPAGEGQMPRVQGGDEFEESDEPTERIDLKQIAPVTQLRIRLRRWMDFPASDENDYAAEVVREGDRSYYRARGATVPITEYEALQVIGNPFLYYFSTALKLHKRIDEVKGTLLAGEGERKMTDEQSGEREPAVDDAKDLKERVGSLVNNYRHGTDDAPYFVAQQISELPTPYAMAVTAAICAELDQYERPRFARLLLTVAQGRYRSVFDRAED